MAPAQEPRFSGVVLRAGHGASNKIFPTIGLYFRSDAGPSVDIDVATWQVARGPTDRAVNHAAVDIARSNAMTLHPVARDFAAMHIRTDSATPSAKRFRQASSTGVLSTITPEGSTLIAIDNNLLGANWLPNRTVLPFIERGGEYWGPPENSAVAIRELDGTGRAVTVDRPAVLPCVKAVPVAVKLPGTATTICIRVSGAMTIVVPTCQDETGTCHVNLLPEWFMSSP